MAQKTFVERRRSLFGMFFFTVASSLMGCATPSPIAPELLKKVENESSLKKGEVALRWLGTAGFTLRTEDSLVVIDPFLTRTPMLQVGFSRLVPNTNVLHQAIPKADVVLVGHSHYDHALDAPAVAAHTGAQLYGTKTTCALTRRLLRVPTKKKTMCHRVYPGQKIVHDDLVLSPVPSLHVATPLFGVPIPGTIPATKPATKRATMRAKQMPFSSPHALDMPMGGALIWVIRTPDLTIVHISSSSLPPSVTTLKEAVPQGADVVLVSAAVHTLTPRYAERIVEELRPRLVIPHHFESFFVPLKEVLDDKDRVDGESFLKRIRDLGVQAQLPDPFVEIVLSDETLPAR